MCPSSSCRQQEHHSGDDAIPTLESIPAELVETPLRRAGLEKWLRNQEPSFDPQESLLKRPFSSPGYHTTLKGGDVHPTRQSLSYALALFDHQGEREIQRARKILDRILDLQDRNPHSPTCGIWSWFLEEPLDKMDPPDYNWADFCGTTLIQIYLYHKDRLGAVLSQRLLAGLELAAEAIRRRNVGPGYTNIALMGTYVVLLSGIILRREDLYRYGMERLLRFAAYTRQRGAFSEYNSPTYTIVALDILELLNKHLGHTSSGETIRELHHFAWRHLLRRFHQPTRQIGGPHSRCYSTLLRSSALAFIQRSIPPTVQIQYMPEEEVWTCSDALHWQDRIPDDLLGYLQAPEHVRVESELLIRGGADPHDVLATTYLHPHYIFGSVNIGDFWNQRRPVIAYWRHRHGVAAWRLRCLHDDYDFSAADCYSLQVRNVIGVGMGFSHDRGDRHITLDRRSDGLLTLQDLRFRLQLEGDIDHLRWEQSGQDSVPSYRFSDETVVVDVYCPFACWDDDPDSVTFELLPDGSGFDIVLFHGEPRTLSWRELAASGAALIIQMRESGEPDRLDPRRISVAKVDSQLAVQWCVDDVRQRRNCRLSLPLLPDASAANHRKAKATLDEHDAWEASF